MGMEGGFTLWQFIFFMMALSLSKSGTWFAQELMSVIYWYGKKAMITSFDFIYEITGSKSAAMYLTYFVYLLLCWWPMAFRMWLPMFRAMFYKKGYFKTQKVLLLIIVIKYIPFWGMKYLERELNYCDDREMIIKKYGSLRKYINKLGILDWLTLTELFFVLYDRLWSTGKSGGYLLCLESMKRLSKDEVEWYSKRSPVCLFVSLLMFKNLSQEG
jgi:hypothetical protein